MADKMSYEDMVMQACDAFKGKFISRAQIKTYLTQHYGWIQTGLTKNALKKTLMKFERKGDSFRVSKEMREKKSGAAKKAVLKAKVAEKKKVMAAKSAEKKAALKAKMMEKKAKIAAKKTAMKEKLAAKKAAALAKKTAMKEKKAAQKAESLAAR